MSLRSQTEENGNSRLWTREGLRRVVNDPGGTAYSKRLKAPIVAGKTGTAQVARLGGRRILEKDMPYELRDHAWFVAFAPADHPEIAVAVLNEHAGHGGSSAAPVAMAVIAAWYEKNRARLGLGAGPPRILAAADEEETSWRAD